MVVLSSKSKITRFPRYFVLGSVLVLTAILFFFVSDFLSTLFIAAVIATATFPLRKFIRRQTKGTRTLASLLTLLAVVLLVIVPLVLFVTSVINQATGVYELFRNEFNKFVDSNYSFLPILDKYPILKDWTENLLKYNPISPQEVVSKIGDFFGFLSRSLLGYTTNIVKQLSLFVIHALIFFFALFYFIRDGEKLVKYIRSLLPLSENHRDLIFGKMYGLMHAVVYGIMGAALAQGIVFGIGLSIAGVHNALFWAALGALFSPLPYVGVGVIWVPIVISLFATQHLGAGTFLLIWCMTAVANIDNIVKPYLIGSRSALHPLAVLVVILGGAFAFGIKGLVFGPLILTLTLAFLEIYREEYRGMLEETEKKK